MGLVETDGGGIASVEYRGFIVDSNLTFAAEKVINLLNTTAGATFGNSWWN
ncbi:MAG TPA: hypothetical protein VK578_01160 [Edaphobacter sp.]|nr:hypothetical protein [Edaphobacter sp.]